MDELETNEDDLVEAGYEQLEPEVALQVFPQKPVSKYPVSMSVSTGVAAGTVATAPIAIAAGGGATGIAGYAAGFGALITGAGGAQAVAITSLTILGLGPIIGGVAGYAAFTGVTKFLDRRKEDKAAKVAETIAAASQ